MHCIYLILQNIINYENQKSFCHRGTCPFGCGSVAGTRLPDASHTCRQGSENRQVAQRSDLLRASERISREAGELLHSTARGFDTGERRPARSGSLPGAHGFQRLGQLQGERRHRIYTLVGRGVRQRPQRIYRYRPDGIPHLQRPVDTPRGSRLVSAHTERLVERSYTRREGD